MRKNNLAYREEFLAGRVGIRAKILIYLAILAGFIISTVWMLQGVLFRGLYRGATVAQMQSAVQTQFFLTIGAILLAIDHGRPRILTLKDLMQCFIDHRFEVLRRRCEHELREAKARAHILEGLLIALDNLDEVVRIIRASRSRDDARVQLMGRFGLSELQANAILDMRLYQLTGLERDKVEAEYFGV